MKSTLATANRGDADVERCGNAVHRVLFGFSGLWQKWRECLPRGVDGCPANPLVRTGCCRFKDTTLLNKIDVGL